MPKPSTGKRLLPRFFQPNRRRPCFIARMTKRDTTLITAVQRCPRDMFGDIDWSRQGLLSNRRSPAPPETAGQLTARYLHIDEGSDRVLLETFGIKFDQSRGINDPVSLSLLGVRRQQDQAACPACLSSIAGRHKGAGSLSFPTWYCTPRKVRHKTHSAIRYSITL